MGWRDRDWGKFTEDEWSAYLAGDPQRARRSPRQRRALGVWALATFVVVCLGAAALAYAYNRVALTSTVRVPVVPAKPSYTEGVTPVITVMAPPAAGVISIRWRAADHDPAASAGHICVNDSQQGQFCADFAAGERPADVLTRHIESLGLSVASSG